MTSPDDELSYEPFSFEAAEVQAVTIDAAARLLSVDVRTIRFWIHDKDSPLPAIVQEGRPTLLWMPCVMLWLQAQRARGRRIWL
jgi:hypothetical protein